MIPQVHVRVRMRMCMHMCSGLKSVSQKLIGIEASDLAYTYIWGRQTETSEPYLMLTYIS